MDVEKIRAALSYLRKKKPELTVQQYRTIKGQILPVMKTVRSVALTGWWNGTGEDVGTMPRRPNTPCKHPGCGRLVPYGTMYCEEHKPLHQHDRKTTAEKGYGSRWQKARAVYLQSHPLCVRCLAKGRYVKATVVDHIIPTEGSEIVLGSGQLAGSL